MIYALLDSRRVAGAYRFVLKPGAETVVEVKARLYLREAVGKLGVAPLTSMFFFGENQQAGRRRLPAGGARFRRTVGACSQRRMDLAAAESIRSACWSPRFATANPLGFGLMQRDREFAQYEDLDARYDRRPSAWVEPKGSWGPGRVELVQIPSPDESNDNIVAYWVPDTCAAPETALGPRVSHALAEGSRYAAAARLGRPRPARPRLTTRVRKTASV